MSTPAVPFGGGALAAARSILAGNEVCPAERIVRRTSACRAPLAGP